MNLLPLQQWICDECGEVIKEPKDGWLEWLSSVNQDVPPQQFRIVHHMLASPKGSCYCEDNNPAINPVLVSNNHLHLYLGSDGLARLLALLSRENRKAKDAVEVAEIIRRLHLPYYEEARLYFEIAQNDGYMDGFNDYAMYMEDTMKRIIDTYSDDN